MSWKVLSALGVLWGFAHLAIEAPLGAGGSNLWRAVLLSTAIWLCVLWLAVRGTQWAFHAAVPLGAVACGWLALSHFARPGSHTVWLGVIPWMTDPEDAPSWVVPPYNLLMYVGVALGVAIVWAGIRNIRAATGRRDLWMPLGLAAIVFAIGLADMLRPASYLPGAGWLWTAAASSAFAAVALIALVLPLPARDLRLAH